MTDAEIVYELMKPCTCYGCVTGEDGCCFEAQLPLK